MRMSCAPPADKSLFTTLTQREAKRLMDKEGLSQREADSLVASRLHSTTAATPTLSNTYIQQLADLLEFAKEVKDDHLKHEESLK